MLWIMELQISKEWNAVCWRSDWGTNILLEPALPLNSLYAGTECQRWEYSVDVSKKTRADIGSDPKCFIVGLQANSPKRVVNCMGWRNMTSTRHRKTHPCLGKPRHLGAGDCFGLSRKSLKKWPTKWTRWTTYKKSGSALDITGVKWWNRAQID